MASKEKNPAAVAMGRLGGRANAAKQRERDPEFFSRIGRAGGKVAGPKLAVQVKAAYAALALVEKLRSLELMPSDEAIAEAEARKKS